MEKQSKEDRELRTLTRSRESLVNNSTQIFLENLEDI